MIVLPLIERLEAARAAIGAKAVAGINDLLEAFATLRASPSLFVAETSEEAGPNTALSQVVSQFGWQRFDVLAGYTKAALVERDARWRIREGVKAALLGWSHPASVGATEYRGHGLLRLDVERQLLFDRISFAFPVLSATEPS